jgi:hypothetical protein
LLSEEAVNTNVIVFWFDPTTLDKRKKGNHYTTNAVLEYFHC